jgi:hydroxymethylbilane synthase
VAEVLEPATLLPQAGQGALAVECRVGDVELIEMLSAIDEAAAHAALSAERAFLAALGGGCSLPCGALATPSGSHRPDGRERVELVLEGMLASRDGHVLLRRSCVGDDPVDLGRRLAADLLNGAGGQSLEDWNVEGSQVISGNDVGSR